jgi:hypothetical protein
VWKPIWDEVAYHGFKECLETPSMGMEIGLEVAIHIDCDCKVTVDCCDGTTKQLVTTDMLPGSGQPGSGSPQPAKDGGQQCYTLNFQATSQALVPTIVNAGDQINIESASGAGTDGAGYWYCVDGSVFFAGTCNGSGYSDLTDPIPAGPHMELIMQINGNWYPAAPGTIFTVPAGVVNQAITIQVNNDSLTACSGSYQMNVCVTNNQVGTVTHVFDFTMSSQGWSVGTVFGDGGAWIPGQGWHNSGGASGSLQIVSPVVASTTFLSAILHYDDVCPGTPNSLSGVGCQLGPGFGSPIAGATPIPACGNGVVNGVASVTGTQLECSIEDANATGVYLSMLTVTMQGPVDPFA